MLRRSNGLIHVAGGRVNTVCGSCFSQTLRNSMPADRAAAAKKARRESGSGSPRAAKTSRARKKPVMRKPSATSSALGRASSRAPSRKKGGSGSSRSRHGSPATRAHRPARLRRDIGEVLDRSGRGAAGEVELEPAFSQDLRLEAGDERGRERRVVERCRRSASASRTPPRADRVPAKGGRARRARRVRRAPARCPSAARRAGPAVRPRRRRDARRGARARRSASVLPGWSTAAMRDERPPRTRPRWRPWARVIASTIAECSPCLLTPMTRPSSRHSICECSSALTFSMSHLSRRGRNGPRETCRRADRNIPAAAASAFRREVSLFRALRRIFRGGRSQPVEPKGLSRMYNTIILRYLAGSSRAWREQ